MQWKILCENKTHKIKIGTLKLNGNLCSVDIKTDGGKIH